MSPHPTLPTRTIETEADIASLQRELAEAKAERDKWRSDYRRYSLDDGAVAFVPCQDLRTAAFGSATAANPAIKDSLTTAEPAQAQAGSADHFCPYHGKAWCHCKPAPGPSDANGEPESQLNTNTDQIGMKPSLTPLTSPIVRGVLVDDGPVRNVFDYGECYLDLEDGSINTCWENARDPWSHNMQPVKLRPASEFGVPGEPIPVQVHSKLEALAESLGIKDWQAAGTSTLATLIAEAVDKLKSTPAEPVQKLVPLPEGVVVLVKREGRSPVVGEYINVNGNLCFVDKHWRGETSDEIWTPLDPALYGVDAERVRELEAEVARLTKDNAQWEESCGLASESAGACQSEAERLRKAIETHRHKNTGMACDHKQSDLELWSALTPPTAELAGSPHHSSTDSLGEDALSVAAAKRGSPANSVTAGETASVQSPTAAGEQSCNQSQASIVGNASGYSTQTSDSRGSVSGASGSCDGSENKTSGTMKTNTTTPPTCESPTATPEVSASGEFGVCMICGADLTRSDQCLACDKCEPPKRAEPKLAVNQPRTSCQSDAAESVGDAPPVSSSAPAAESEVGDYDWLGSCYEVSSLGFVVLDGIEYIKRAQAIRVCENRDRVCRPDGEDQPGPTSRDRSQGVSSREGQEGRSASVGRT